MQRSNRYTLIFVFIAIVGVYFSYKTFSDDIKEAPQYTYASIIDVPKNNNLDYMYEIIQDDLICTTISYELTESIRYINIILEDVPKAKNIKEYYNVNKIAINDIFSFSSEKDFEEFYNKIKSVSRLRSYEIVEGTINNILNKYFFKLKLIGVEDVEISMQIYIQDKEKYKAKCYWNRESSL